MEIYREEKKKLAGRSLIVSVAVRDGGKRRWRGAENVWKRNGKKIWGKVQQRMLERTPAPLIMIKRFFTKRMEALQFFCTRKSGPDAVYCVERLLYTIIVHIQLPLQHLICIIGSLMKLPLWNKKILKKKKERKEKSEMEKVVWCMCMRDWGVEWGNRKWMNPLPLSSHLPHKYLLDFWERRAAEEKE